MKLHAPALHALDPDERHDYNQQHERQLRCARAVAQRLPRAEDPRRKSIDREVADGTEISKRFHGGQRNASRYCGTRHRPGDAPPDFNRPQSKRPRSFGERRTALGKCGAREEIHIGVKRKAEAQSCRRPAVYIWEPVVTDFPTGYAPQRRLQGP